ncbi:LacI family DNA-binding transcriptional regulator [Kineosporia babensis]|uniref:LacI family DNA-binding transcriptional regulator n=1 Tax=Kineosporia babensis TaxID=499548 RepID=A0A9X1NKB6_9ACTN|nr:LacI family DNA-binding transcriptional regulator [Kineosporia babensis]MCD5314751.1 LacI family DNA-binding transcriptional regulator [Kineosporia babensis]
MGEVRSTAGRPPTIYDVARLAGVSHQTVSRYLRGEEGIRPANRQRVLRALDELSYTPNLSARSLASRTSRRITVLTQEIGLVGPGRVLQGANAEARRAGYLLDIVTLDVTDRAAIDDALRQSAGPDVAGILALASTDELVQALAQAEFRVTTLVNAERDDTLAGPEQDNARGMDLVVEHLAALGHQRFFLIGGPRSWVAARNRELAYDIALRERSLHSVAKAHGDWSAASGYAAAHALPLHEGITAVVAANDQMAMGAVLALSEAGLRVPADVSVTGMDDMAEAAYLCPPLTTVHLDFEEQGRDAFRRLLAQIEGRAPAPAAMTATLMPRASSGPAKG